MKLNLKEVSSDIKQTCTHAEQQVYALENKFELLRLEREHRKRELAMSMD